MPTYPTRRADFFEPEPPTQSNPKSRLTRSRTADLGCQKKLRSVQGPPGLSTATDYSLPAAAPWKYARKSSPADGATCMDEDEVTGGTGAEGSATLAAAE